MQGSRSKVDKTLRSRFQGINKTNEGYTVKEYLEHKLEVLGHKALTCDPSDIEEIQGRARELEDLLRDLTSNRGVDGNNS